MARRFLWFCDMRTCQDKMRKMMEHHPNFAPRYRQHGLQDGPKLNLKTGRARLGCQDAPRSAQDGSKRAQEPPKSPQERPKRGPRPPKRPPKRPPRGFQERPKRPQEQSRRRQDSQRSFPEAPRRGPVKYQRYKATIFVNAWRSSANRHTDWTSGA